MAGCRGTREQRLGPIGLVLGVLALGGCSERTLSAADCAAVGKRLEEAWKADANQAIALAETEQFRRFVVDEGASIAERWSAACRPWVGREVDQAELTCLLSVERIADVDRCSSR